MVETPPRAGPSPPHGPARFPFPAAEPRVRSGSSAEPAAPRAESPHPTRNPEYPAMRPPFTGTKLIQTTDTPWRGPGFPGVGFASGDRHLTGIAHARTCLIRTEGLTIT
ncbi:hypothetical protein GCM10022206_72360 [Streptomyces chiangmaiensis]